MPGGTADDAENRRRFPVRRGSCGAFSRQETENRENAHFYRAFRAAADFYANTENNLSEIPKCEIYNVPAGAGKLLFPWRVRTQTAGVRPSGREGRAMGKTPDTTGFPPAPGDQTCDPDSSCFFLRRNTRQETHSVMISDRIWAPASPASPPIRFMRNSMGR